MATISLEELANSSMGYRNIDGLSLFSAEPVARLLVTPGSLPYREGMGERIHFVL